MGPTGCSEKSVRNYHSKLHIISEECTSHITVWWCRP